MKHYHLILFGLVFFSMKICAQEISPVQFSGLVVSEDRLLPVPFTHIIIEESGKGTISDFYGFFSFVARPGDIIIFSSVGYKRSYFKIPDTLTIQHYTMYQVMQIDTLYLPETRIYPWPSLSQFRDAFLSLRVPVDDYDRAKKNIALIAAKENYLTIPMDGSMNYKLFVQNQISNFYTLGQMPVNNLLNPLAWAAFLKALQSGELKKTDVDYWNNFPDD